jgi:hypothetical protein
MLNLTKKESYATNNEGIMRNFQFKFHQFVSTWFIFYGDIVSGALV